MGSRTINFQHRVGIHTHSVGTCSNCRGGPNLSADDELFTSRFESFLGSSESTLPGRNILIHESTEELDDGFRLKVHAGQLPRCPACRRLRCRLPALIRRKCRTCCGKAEPFSCESGISGSVAGIGAVGGRYLRSVSRMSLTDLVAVQTD